MVVHQLIPTFHEGDATSQAAVHFVALLRRLGIQGELYAGEVAPGARSFVQPASRLRPEPDDVVLYHHGIASGLAGVLMHLRCRRGMVFHNISPVKTYLGTPLEEALLGGRAQLAALAEHVELSIGVSAFNCAELREAGHRNVHHVPLFVEPGRFVAARADAKLLAASKHDGLRVLSVSRVAPHKRVEDLLTLHAELLHLDPRARLRIVGGYDAGGPYFRTLSRQAKDLPGVEFLGKVDHAQLVAAYRWASVYVSMSEHEGFGVPLVEAMAAEVPVVAYAAAAVPETLGGAGVAFDEKQFALVAELVHTVGTDAPLRARILKGQRRRLEELSADRAQERLGEALATVGHARPAARPLRRGAKPKVAVLVQRYGEISGGAELLARDVVRRLSGEWDITVLTTCAKDHLTWANEFPAGASRDGRATVLRFPTARPRRMRAFNAYCRGIFGRPQERVREERFVAEQGPAVPGLFRHLAAHQGDYDGFVCFTYLYSLAAWGLPMVADRALMVTTAHDEPPLQFELYRDVFERPRALICLTPEERELIARRFPDHAPAFVASTGVEARKAKPERFRKRHGLERPYLFYVGRVEAGKGIPELVSHHQKLVRQFHDAPELVIAGASSIQVSGDRVRYLGRISEEDKYDALTGALAVVVPSRYESLSLLLLEAFAQGTPCLVNGESEVLAAQIRRSGAGFAYTDARSFIEGVQQLGADRERLGEKGAGYAKQYTWDKVLAVYREQMARIVEGRR